MASVFQGDKPVSIRFCALWMFLWPELVQVFPLLRHTRPSDVCPAVEVSSTSSAALNLSLPIKNMPLYQ